MASAIMPTVLSPMAFPLRSQHGPNGSHAPLRPRKTLTKNPTAANTSAKRGRITPTHHVHLPSTEQGPKQPSASVVEVASPPERPVDSIWSTPVVNPGWHLSPGQTPAPPQAVQLSALERRRSSLEQRSMLNRTRSHHEAPFAPFSPPFTTEPSDEETIGADFPPSRSSTGSPGAVPESVKPTLYTALGAGRLDPFQVYCKKDLPLYVHAVLDHYLHHVCCSFTLATEGIGQSVVMSHVMGHAMRDPLTWYAIILAGVTHYMYVQHDRDVPQDIRMLRLSYKTQAMAEIRENIAQDPASVSESTLFAINTLAVHGGAMFEDSAPRDRVQDGKAFGHANQLDYYSTIEVEWEHWNMFTRLMRKRGGPSTLSFPEGIPGFPPSPGPGCLTTSDTTIAWRNLRCPEFALVISTDHVINLQSFKADQAAIVLGQKLLSGFPTMSKSSMHFRRLTGFLKNVRKLVIDFEQYQRGAAPSMDLRKLHWTRLMLVNDLLLLPDLEMSDNPVDLLYELCRNCLMAFMQMVLCPVVASNRMPEKILKQLIPVLQRSTVAIHGRTLDREHPSLFLWAVLLAGMLAMEHYQTQSDSALLDEVSAFIDRTPIKAEKNSWSMAVKVAQTFLWLDSECDLPGRRYWNYACLWLAERRRDVVAEAT